MRPFILIFAFLSLTIGIFPVAAIAQDTAKPQTQSVADELQKLTEKAEKGDAESQFNLGFMYSNGQGVHQDYTEAKKWYLLAAKQGYAGAQFNVALMYKNGLGAPQDNAEAFKWYLLAADQNYAGAQFNLGNMYSLGNGVPQDYAEAMKWYRKAADQGVPDAQFNLGNMYANGHGMPQDEREAAKWYRKAAEQGNASAQNVLGDMYGLGKGVPQDSTEAYAWLSAAAYQGNKDAASVRDDLAKELTPDSLLRAQQLSKKYFADYVNHPSALQTTTAAKPRTEASYLLGIVLLTLAVWPVVTQVPFLIARKPDAGIGRRVLAYFAGCFLSLAIVFGLTTIREQMGVPPQQAEETIGLGMWYSLLGPWLGLNFAKKNRKKHAPFAP